MTMSNSISMLYPFILCLKEMRDSITPSLVKSMMTDDFTKDEVIKSLISFKLY